MDESTYKVRGKSTSPNTITEILEDEVLIWREKRLTGEKINQWNFIDGNVDNMKTTRNIQRAQNNVKQQPYTTNILNI
jgi:hypothetical protein